MENNHYQIRPKGWAKQVKAFCLLGLLSVISLNSFGAAKFYEVTGNVSAKESNEPVVYALVALGSQADSSIVMTTYTDSLGNYQLANVKDGQYYILAQMVGYDKINEPIELDTTKNNVRKDFQLSIKQTKEVNVVAKRPFIESKSDRLVMNMDAQLASVGESVFDNLKKAPGVYIDKDDNINLRGKQGVLVMVNEKPTYLSGNQLTNYLKGMQVSEVEKIEIIINPPAKYDASGNSGIINIKLKKNSKIGLNGTMWAGAWRGEYTSGNFGGNVNYRAGKLNVFASVYPGEYKGYSTMDMDRHVLFNNINTTFSQFSRGNWDYKVLGYNAGADYDLDNRQTIGFMTRLGHNMGADDRKSTNDIFNGNTVADSSLLALSNNSGTYKNQSYNLNYKISLDTTGREFSADLDYAFYRNNDDNEMNTSYFDPLKSVLRSPSAIRGNTPVDVDIQSIKMDYIHPFMGYRIEAGAKASMVKTDNEIEYQNYVGNVWINDLRRSNHFKYSESVIAAYTAVSKELGKYSLKAGLRMENTNSDGNSITLAQRNKRSYVDFFPSFFVQRKISDNQNIGFNYNRRIDRPNYQNLNPFVYYIDEYTFEKGNAFLNPQYTNSFTLNHSFRNAIFTALSYSRTNDAQIDMIRQNDTTKIGYQVRENIDYSENFNLNIGFNLPVTKWYRINANMNAYTNRFYSKKGNDNINNDSYTMNAWTGHYFTLPKNYVLEITSWYQAPQAYGVFDLSGQYNIGMGIQKQILKQRGQIKLFVRDIFNSSKETVKMWSNGNLVMLNKNKWDSRQFGFNFSYRFGRDDVKPSREHKTGLDDEQNRVKTGK
jgi:hypothetical protein